jgi:hypothetical protein
LSLFKNIILQHSTHQVHLVKTSCGDAYNIGLDKEGRAYSLPSPLDFHPFPSDTQHKVGQAATFGIGKPGMKVDSWV